MADGKFATDKRQAAQWARELMARGFVVLDTETTGLNRHTRDEACQIAVVDHTGAVLLDTLLKPSIPIPADAARLHGITDDMVKDAPTFEAIFPDLAAAIAGRVIVIYNAEYDEGILYNMLDRCDWLSDGEVHTSLGAAGLTCAMEAYAEFYGDWNDYHGSYRWQKLTYACLHECIEIDAPAHSALGDALRTLALVKVMAAFETEVTAD